MTRLLVAVILVEWVILLTWALVFGGAFADYR